MLLEDQVISLSWGNLVSKRKIKQAPLGQGAVQEQIPFPPRDVAACVAEVLQTYADYTLKQKGLYMFPSTETQTPPVYVYPCWFLKLIV